MRKVLLCGYLLVLLYLGLCVQLIYSVDLLISLHYINTTAIRE